MELDTCCCQEMQDANQHRTLLDAEDSNRDILMICKICYNGDEEEALLSPCNCSGSIKYVHQSCLLKWLKARKPICELCNREYVILKKAKPYEQVSNKNA